VILAKGDVINSDKSMIKKHEDSAPVEKVNLYKIEIIFRENLI